MLGYFVVPLGVGATLGAGTGAPEDVDDGPAVDVSGGGSGSAFEPVPGVAPLGDGAMERFSVLELDPLEPGSGSTFDPVPGVAPTGEGDVEAPLVPEVAGLPVVPCADDPPAASLDGDGGVTFGADGALLPLSSTGVTARAAAGTASAATTAAVARCGTRRMDMSVLPSDFRAR